ncbi:MAG: sugar transferase [Synechococcales cyanobacterium CRU_2_2]|nr:sugar transferase [Synechococcales cyanobacterium CRU_2_2]
MEYSANHPLSDTPPLEQAQTLTQAQGPQAQGPQAQKQSRLWLNLSGQDSEQLRALASDSTVQTRLRQSSVAGVYLSLDVAQDVLETWAGACLASGKPSFILVPQAQQVFARQRNSWKWHFKRLGDRLVAALLLLLLSPLMIVLAILVKCSSSGPVFFRQWRVGQQGQLFRIFKFRTMGAGAERQHHQVMGQQQGLNKCENDPRVTWVGRWMRKSSLDELPQLFNVITGEMSLVGPRPWALYDAVQIRPSDRHRLRALPGITGLWQVSGRSQLLDIDRVTGLDLQYIKTWSLRNDLKILLMTFPSVILGRGAC